MWHHAFTGFGLQDEIPHEVLEEIFKQVKHTEKDPKTFPQQSSAGSVQTRAAKFGQPPLLETKLKPAVQKDVEADIAGEEEEEDWDLAPQEDAQEETLVLNKNWWCSVVRFSSER